MKTHLELEEFKFTEDVDQVFNLELSFGNLETKSNPITVLANRKGLLSQISTFKYDDIQC